MDRAVLAVDGHELGAGVARSGCTTGPAAIRLSLLASAEPLAGTQRRDRDRQPGEADDAVDHDIGHVDQIGLIGDDLGPNGSAAATSARVVAGRRLRPPWVGTRSPGRSASSTDDPTPSADDLVAARPSARTTSSVWVPIDPDEPAIATRTGAMASSASTGPSYGRADSTVQGSSTMVR